MAEGSGEERVKGAMGRKRGTGEGREKEEEEGGREEGKEDEEDMCWVELLWPWCAKPFGTSLLCAAYGDPQCMRKLGVS